MTLSGPLLPWRVAGLVIIGGEADIGLSAGNDAVDVVDGARSRQRIAIG